MLRTLDQSASHDVNVMALRHAAAHLGRFTGDGARATGARSAATGARRMHRLGGFWSPENGETVRLRTAFVSEQHVVVAWHDGALYACDLSSTHGTYVNRKAISPMVPHVLKDGDLLELSSPSSPSGPVVPGLPRFLVEYPPADEHAARSTSRSQKRVAIRPHDEAEKELIESVTCPVCAEVLADAASGNCVHVFCYTCVITTILKSRQGPKCPVCRDPSLGNVRRVLCMDGVVDLVLERFGTPEQIRRLRLRKHLNALFRRDVAIDDAAGAPRVDVYESREANTLNFAMTFPRGDAALLQVGLPTLRRFLKSA